MGNAKLCDLLLVDNTPITNISWYKVPCNLEYMTIYLILHTDQVATCCFLHENQKCKCGSRKFQLCDLIYNSMSQPPVGIIGALIAIENIPCIYFHLSAIHQWNTQSSLRPRYLHTFDSLWS